MTSRRQLPPGSLTQREASFRLLAMCLRENDSFDAPAAVELAQRSSDEVLLATARYHRVGGVAYQRLRALPVPAATAHGLRQMYSAAVDSHMRVLWTLAQVQPVLDASGARWAVVKGPVLAELVYRDPGARTYHDLDLLIEPDRFRLVVDRLEASGAKLLDRNWEVIRRERFGELHHLVEGGVLVDLHWSLVTIYRARTAMSTTEILSRQQRVAVAGIPAWTLHPADRLLHLCVHAALSGADRLVWLKDVDLASRGVEWDAVAERAKRWRLGPAVGLILSRAATVLGTAIPEGLPERLLGAYYARLVRVVDRASPWEYGFGRVTMPSSLLARSIGQGPLGSAAWLLRRAVRNLDPREPLASSAFTPRGDASDREAFFEAVAQSE